MRIEVADTFPLELAADAHRRIEEGHTRGKLVLATAALMVVVGAFRGAPPLVAMGGSVLVALLAAYLGFFPAAVLLRRKKIELSWWVPPGDQPGGALAPERPFQLHIAYRNHGSRTLRVLATRVLTGRGLEVAPCVPATVAAGQQVEHTTDVRPAVGGCQVLHGAVLVPATCSTCSRSTPTSPTPSR